MLRLPKHEQRGELLGSQLMSKKEKQKYKPGSMADLKDQLQNVENKLRAEMSWFREEIAPLKNKQRQLLHEIEKLQ
jgi:predicted  nucleic acid-binding Zn-ribbon protein